MRKWTLYIKGALVYECLDGGLQRNCLFEEARRKKRHYHYELNVAPFLEVYLFFCSVFDYGTSKLMGNMQTEKKKGHSL